MTKLYYLLFSLLFLIFSCESNEDIEDSVQEFKFLDTDLIIGLASPVKLNTDSTVIRIKDYVPQNIEITTISTHEAIQHSLSNDSLFLTLKVISDDLPKLSLLKLNIVGIEYSILLKKSNKESYKITFDPKGKNYQKVAMKGEMNKWVSENTRFTSVNGIWEAEFEAEPGEYQYLLELNGNSVTDPGNPDKVKNGFGTYNSLIKVGKYKELNKPILYTSEAGNNYLKITSKNNVSKLIVIYKNYELDERFISLKNDTFQIIFPGDAKELERTHIRIWAYNDDGISNDLLIPLHKNEVIKDASLLNRQDFHASILYNVFVDRFFDGDLTNNEPTKNKGIHPRANYHGGDISGIIKKINDGYFKKLGVNTLWISPIVKNPKGAYGLYPNPKTTFSAYHGYWPISFTLIDERFGTEEEFKTLVKIAHENDMNVLLDFVANHVHMEHPVYKEHKDWATNLYLPDGTLNTEKWDDHRLTTWFDVFLPTLELRKPEVYNMLSDSAVYWIKKYNLDGFRHDATKHIPEIFWQTLTQKLKEQIIIPQNRNLYQIGETYGTAELISSYVNTGQLDAQFDFNMYDAVVKSIAGLETFEHFAKTIENSLKYYGSHHLMGNITGNQDRARFISYASNSLSFDEDAKFAGWTRQIEVIDSVGFDKCAMLNAVISTIPGLPVIYYGDEIGMPGANDPDNRRMMRFENLNYKEEKLKQITLELLKFRRNSLALIFGDFEIIKAQDNLLIYKRAFFEETIIVVINNSDIEKNISFEINSNPKDPFFTLFKSEFKNKNRLFEIKLKANSFDIITNQKQ